MFADNLSSFGDRGWLKRWQHMIRNAILKLLPAGKLAEHFHPELGRLTRELNSMAGLQFIMEFRNLSHEEAVIPLCFTRTCSLR